MPSDERHRIAELEERLVHPSAQAEACTSAVDLEMLADLYLQADSHLPALETIERLLRLPDASGLAPSRRASLESKAIACRIARGDYHAALGQCRDLLVREAELAPPSLRTRIVLQCSDALLRLGRLRESAEMAGRGLALADAQGELAQAAEALNLLGRVEYREGDPLAARDHYEQALALYRRLGDDTSSAYVRGNLGLLHKNLCEWEAAIAHLDAAVEMHRAAGRLPAIGNAQQNLGIVRLKSGRWDLAIRHFSAAEQVHQQLGDPLMRARVTIAQGNVARLQRRFGDSERLLLAALGDARAIGAQREEVLALEFLGELSYERGHHEAALARYREALAMGESIAPEGDLVVEIERRRADALVALGRHDDAAVSAARARRLARLTSDRLEYALSMRAEAAIALGAGRRSEAASAFRTAIERLTECRDPFELGRTLLAASHAETDVREARRLLYRATALFAELDAPYWLERGEQELERRNAPSTNGADHADEPASLLGRRHRAPSLVACSGAMQRVESLARRAASTELSVLVTGETGTGKELIARTIHGLSPRADRPFLAVNCGALRADLALSQLFGHRKGAFTGAHAEGVGLVEAAHGGTLFLDEVGELPHDVQVTLLRFLESGEYLRLGETRVRRADVRVIAATNRELRGSEGERLFRRDLLFRLNEIEIRLPALRERPDDVLPLARHFLAFYGGLHGPRLLPEAESVLRAYAWPGNVRELENVMKRVAALHAGDGTIDAEALLPFLAQPAPAARNGDGGERTAILNAYEMAGGNKSRVAELLGVSRKTLYARLKRLQITLP